MMEMDEKSLPMFILRLGESGMKKHPLPQKWEPFKIVNLFMDHPVQLITMSITRQRNTLSDTSPQHQVANQNITQPIKYSTPQYGTNQRNVQASGPSS